MGQNDLRKHVNVKNSEHMAVWYSARHEAIRVSKLHVPVFAKYGNKIYITPRQCVLNRIDWFTNRQNIAILSKIVKFIGLRLLSTSEQIRHLDSELRVLHVTPEKTVFHECMLEIHPHFVCNLFPLLMGWCTVEQFLDPRNSFPFSWTNALNQIETTYLYGRTIPRKLVRMVCKWFRVDSIKEYFDNPGLGKPRCNGEYLAMIKGAHEFSIYIYIYININ